MNFSLTDTTLICYNLLSKKIYFSKGGLLVELDYSLTTPEERVDYVKKLLADNPPLNNSTLTILADYILFIRDRNQTKKERTEERPILTPNREFTIDKRQISYEGLVEKLENGEDGLYNIIRQDKNQILDPKAPITIEDIEKIPGIKECMDVIISLKQQAEKASKYRRKQLNQAIIETWKQAYTIKGSYNMIGHIKSNSQIRNLAGISIPEKIYLDENKMPHSDMPLSLLNPEHVSFLLCYYQILKQESWEDLHCDMRWHLIDLEDLAEEALKENHPMLWDILIWKVDGLTNEEIKQEVLEKYGELHSEQYYSSLWRKRIPKLISEQFQKNYVEWYFTEKEYGYWKRCSKCGKIKLGHSLFFAKNSSKDGWYSQCKECKNSSRSSQK